jgi:uncharacterized DUF497 family protein
MDFGWDEKKNAANLQKHGLSFDLAALLFRTPTLEEPDNRRDYGERRLRVYGAITGRVLVCIFTDRQLSGRDVRWIISLRKANQREVRRFNDRIKTANQDKDRYRGGA